MVLWHFVDEKLIYSFGIASVPETCRGDSVDLDKVIDCMSKHRKQSITENDIGSVSITDNSLEINGINVMIDEVIKAIVQASLPVKT